MFSGVVKLILFVGFIIFFSFFYGIYGTMLNEIILKYMSYGIYLMRYVPIDLILLVFYIFIVIIYALIKGFFNFTNQNE